jgi:glycosyltransferase involved in cell wall biosynthesis
MTAPAPHSASAPLLSIGIPTRNRSRYLLESLGALADQILELGPDRASLVSLHVSDNTSTDDTPAVIQSIAARFPRLTSHRHPENVGASRNVNSCVRAATGRFCWIVGDDEIICPGAVRHLVELLSRDDAPALVLCFETNYDPQLPRPHRFPSYREYVAACARTNPHALIEHTLVTSNVFRTALFDQKVAVETLATDYSHMYAMLSGLIAAGGGSVHVTDQPVITVRDRRAPAVDGVWPTDLESSWRAYLQWQRDRFDVPSLQPEAAIEMVRRKLMHKLTRQPLRYLANNLHALKDPKAWGWFLKRLKKHLLGS